MTPLRIAYAGDRDIAIWVLDFILRQGVKPLALLLTDAAKASHARELRSMCDFLLDERVLWGDSFRKPEGVRLLKELDLDYIIGVHFPYLVPESVLAASRHGVLNLHPAYLPYNRGWHTPSWAILEGTPVGATLHFMDAGIDTGEIVHQERLAVAPEDTADSLYRRLKQLELEVFKQSWPHLVTGLVSRASQDPAAGTAHKRKDLYCETVQRIELDRPTTARELLKRMLALTTNHVDEAAYYEIDGRRYRLQVAIHPE